MDANVVQTSSTSITDLPPEMLKHILAKLDNNQNSLLPYRLVHPLWKAIINDLLEEKCLKLKYDGCAKVYIVKNCTKNEMLIECPAETLQHTGNPFPSSSLTLVGSNSIIEDIDFEWWCSTYQQRCEHNSNEGEGQKVRLETFTSKLGNYLTSFTLYALVTSCDVVANILSHLVNIKTLTVSEIILTDSQYKTLPTLCNLTNLELTSSAPRMIFEDMDVFAWFLVAYANQLKKLELHSRFLTDPQLILKDLISEQGGAFNLFQNLDELVISSRLDFFLNSFFSPPLKFLTIKKHYFVELNPKKLMLLIHKFSDTLERLELDFEWNNLFFDSVGGTVFLTMDSPFPANRRSQVLEELLSVPILKFPKLIHFSVAFPTTDAELRVINEAFLVKFPALQKLQLLLFGGMLPSLQYENENDIERLQNQMQKLQDFFRGVDYWKLCSGLKRISVVARKRDTILDDSDLFHSLDEADLDNVTCDVDSGHVYSTTRDEYESANLTNMQKM